MGQLANNEWREGWLDEGFSDFQEGWFFETHGGPAAYDGLEPSVLWLDLERWSEPVSTVSEQFSRLCHLPGDGLRQGAAVLRAAALRGGRRDDAAHPARLFLSLEAEARDEDAFRRVAEEVSNQDLKWLFGEWLHATPLIDYRLRRVERHRLPPPDGRWRTIVTIERKGDGRMPVEIGDRDTIYAEPPASPPPNASRSQPPGSPAASCSTRAVAPTTTTC